MHRMLDLGNYSLPPSLVTYGMMNSAYGAELNVTLNDDDLLHDKKFNLVLRFSQLPLQFTSRISWSRERSFLTLKWSAK